MKSKFINVLLFAAGAAIGSAVTWKVVKTKYDRLIQEEIDSVKEAFTDRIENTQGQNEDDACDQDEDEVQRISSTTHIDWSELEDLDEDDDDDSSEKDLEEYDRLVRTYTNEKGGAEKVVKEPYVIAPYDFGELDDYSQIELTYYEDGTLERDDDYSVITNVDELIGSKALTTFGEYEDDAVFVRNERLKADFQILKDYRTYEEARSTDPGRDDD